MQICLKCARQEHDTSLATCKNCGGTLWIPQNVNGQANNTNIDEAAKLIRAGNKPWEKA